MSKFTSNFGIEVPSKEYIEKWRELFKKLNANKKYPPKSNALVEATIDALNKLNLNKTEEPIIISNKIEEQTRIPNKIPNTVHFENNLPKISDENINKLLSEIGLKRRFIAKDPEFYVCDKNHFIEYVSKKYEQNSELREMDEVYRMHEQILLHKETGLRFRYSTYENYDGDEVEYKFVEMFVLNDLNETLKVFEVNIRKRLVITEEGEISFDKLSKTIF